MFDTDDHLRIVFPLVGDVIVVMNVKQVFFLDFGQLVKRRRQIVLQLKVRLLHFQHGLLPHLCIHSDVHHLGLLSHRPIEVALLVEHPSIVEEDDIFASEPLKDVFFGLTVVVPFANIEGDM